MNKILRNYIIGAAIGLSLSIGWYSHVAVVYYTDLKTKAGYWQEEQDHAFDLTNKGNHNHDKNSSPTK